MLSHFGSEEGAYRAIYDATSQAVRQMGLKGIYKVLVVVEKFTITVEGKVVGGRVYIGSFYIP